MAVFVLSCEQSCAEIYTGFVRGNVRLFLPKYRALFEDDYLTNNGSMRFVSCAHETIVFDVHFSPQPLELADDAVHEFLGWL